MFYSSQLPIPQSSFQRQKEIEKACKIAWYPNMSDFAHVFCISDLHGDRLYLEALLKITRVINSQGKWVARNTALVVIGDLLDRYRPGTLSFGTEAKEELNILLRLNDLDVQARKLNSKIFKVIGNHELMNFRGRFSHVHPKHLEDYGGSHGRYKALDIGGELRRQFIACGSYTMVRIAHLVFCHAGLIDSHSNKDIEFKSNKILNELLELPSDEWSHHPEFELLSHPESILHSRKLSSSTDGNCNELTNAFISMGLDPQKHQLIVGHQPGISRCSPGITCHPFMQYVDVIARERDRTILGGRLAFLRRPHGISMMCVNNDGIPRLFVVDTAGSRAFDIPRLLQKDLLVARRPSALWFDMTKGGFSKVIVANFDLPRD